MRIMTFAEAQKILTTQPVVFGHPEHVLAARLVSAYHAFVELCENGDKENETEPPKCASELPDCDCPTCGQEVDPVDHCDLCNVKCLAQDPDDSRPNPNCDYGSLLQALDPAMEAHCRLALAVNNYKAYQQTLVIPGDAAA